MHVRKRVHVRKLYIQLSTYRDFAKDEVIDVEVVVKVFHSEPPCPKCRATEKVVDEVAKEYSGKVKVVKLSALSEEADKYGVLMTPTVVINDKVAFSGKVPAKEELKRALEQAMK